MISAAEVMTRPVRARPSITACVVVARSLPGLLDVRHQEDLVVHRQPEQDREHHQRHVADDRHRAVEADERRAPALLEDRSHDAERGADRDQVHQPGGQRDQRPSGRPPSAAGSSAPTTTAIVSDQAARDLARRDRRSRRSCRRRTAVMSVPLVAFGIVSSRRRRDEVLGRLGRRGQSSASALRMAAVPSLVDERLGDRLRRRSVFSRSSRSVCQARIASPSDRASCAGRPPCSMLGLLASLGCDLRLGLDLRLAGGTPCGLELSAICCPACRPAAWPGSSDRTPACRRRRSWPGRASPAASTCRR